MRYYDIQAEEDNHWHVTGFERRVAAENCERATIFKDYDTCYKSLVKILILMVDVWLLFSILVEIYFSVVTYAHYRRADLPVSQGGCPVP